MSKYTASHVLRTSGRGRRARRPPWLRWCAREAAGEAVEAVVRPARGRRRGPGTSPPPRAAPPRRRGAPPRRGPPRASRPARAAARRGARGCRSTRRAPPTPRRGGSRSRRCPRRGAGSRRGRCGPAGPARAKVPSVRGWRCGCRSRIHRPVRSRSSSARAGSGHQGPEGGDLEAPARRPRPWRSPTTTRAGRRARRAGSRRTTSTARSPAPPRAPRRATRPRPRSRASGARPHPRPGAAAIPGVPSQPSPEVGQDREAPRVVERVVRHRPTAPAAAGR